ncbi:MAG: hypothetical protein GY772_32220, partial [bacterium]|nr:hypothetical protein [bacterium]
RSQTAAKAEQPPKKRAATTKSRLGATALRWRRHSESTLPEKGFDAVDLGQGRRHGGSNEHFKQRFDLFGRVAARFADLDAATMTNLNRDFRLIDEQRRRRENDHYGSTFRNEMRQLLEDCAAGQEDAFLKWLRTWRRRCVPRAEVYA